MPRSVVESSAGLQTKSRLKYKKMGQRLHQSRLAAALDPLTAAGKQYSWCKNRLCAVRTMQPVSTGIAGRESSPAMEKEQCAGS